MTSDGDSDQIGQRRVGSVHQAIAILRHLEASGVEAGVNQIARTLDISPSSCFNLLKTLTDEQFVEFDAVSKRYRLGPGAIALGRRAFDPLGSFQMVRERLEVIADRHQVTVALLRPRRGDQLMLVGFAECAAAFRINLSVGQRLPVAAGAAGRCAMAFSGLDDTTIRRRLEVVKWGAAPDAERYLREVAEVRARGWIVDIDQYIKGVTTVGVPVLGRSGLFEFAITAAMFSGQHDAARLEAISEDLRGAATWLSARLFGGPEEPGQATAGPGKSARKPVKRARKP